MRTRTRLIMVAMCGLTSLPVFAKNVGSVAPKGMDQGVVMLNDDLSSLEFCKGPVAFITKSRAQAPVGCWRRVKDGVRVLWGPRNEVFFAEQDIKWMGEPPRITPSQ
jgi:hypothetical protein